MLLKSTVLINKLLLDCTQRLLNERASLGWPKFPIINKLSTKAPQQYNYNNNNPAYKCPTSGTNSETRGASLGSNTRLVLEVQTTDIIIKS